MLAGLYWCGGGIIPYHHSWLADVIKGSCKWMLSASCRLWGDTQLWARSLPIHPAIALALLSAEMQALQWRGGCCPSSTWESKRGISSVLPWDVPAGRPSSPSSWWRKRHDQRVNQRGRVTNSCTLSHCCCESLLLFSFFIDYPRKNGWLSLLVPCKQPPRHAAFRWENGIDSLWAVKTGAGWVLSLIS